MNPRIIKVETLQDYKLLLEFANGENKIFDMKKYLDLGVFKELKDVNYFNKGNYSAGFKLAMELRVNITSTPLLIEVSITERKIQNCSNPDLN